MNETDAPTLGSTLGLALGPTSLRHRSMPCPHCDSELSLALSEQSHPECPRCELPLSPVRVAGFWRRSAAALIDLAILALTAGPLAWGLHRLLDPAPLAPGAHGLDLLLSVGATDLDTLLLRAGPLLVLASIYFGLTTLLRGQTVGQRVLAIQVIDRYGRRPHPARILVRALTQVAGTSAGALGLLWIAIDDQKRGLHDLLAGTYVVRST